MDTAMATDTPICPQCGKTTYEKINGMCPDCEHLTRVPIQRSRKRLDCDQVGWLLGILERLIEAMNQSVPSTSRFVETAKIASVLEIMEMFGYEFRDAEAASNALSRLPEFNNLRRIR